MTYEEIITNEKGKKCHQVGIRAFRRKRRLFNLIPITGTWYRVSTLLQYHDFVLWFR